MAVKEIGTLAVYLTMPRDDFNKGLKEAQAGIGKLSSGIATFAVAGAASITALATASVNKFMESEAAAKQLDQTLKSTKFAAGFNSEQLKRFSDELKGVSVFGGTALNRAMALMATFTSVKGDIFKQAMVAAMDLNSALGGDIQGNVIQLGKALNNPITGMTALRRVGVSFTKEQETAVESLVNAGKLEEAQMVILNELQVEFGGQAKAMSQTTMGAYLKMQNAMGGLSKQIGDMTVEGLGLVDAMNKKASAINSVTKWFASLDDATKNSIVRTAALATGIGTLIGAYKAMVWTGLSQGIAGLAKYVYYLGTHTAASTLNTSALYKEVQAQNALNISRAAALKSMGMGSMGKGIQTIGTVSSTGVVTLAPAAAEAASLTKNSMPFFTAMKTMPALSFAASSAMAGIASGAAVVGTAIAGWKIGDWISEFTGLKSVLTDFYAKWIFGIEQVQKKSDELDAKVREAWKDRGTRGIIAAAEEAKAKAAADAKYRGDIQGQAAFDPERAREGRKLQDEIRIAGMSDVTLQDKLAIIAEKRANIMRESLNVGKATGDAAKDLEAEENRIQKLREEDVRLQIERNKLVEDERKKNLDAQAAYDEKINDIKFKNANSLEEKLKLLTQKRVDIELKAAYAGSESEKLKLLGESADIEQQMKELKDTGKDKYVAPRLAGAVEKGTIEAYRAELAGKNGDLEYTRKTADNTDKTVKELQTLNRTIRPLANLGVA